MGFNSEVVMHKTVFNFLPISRMPTKDGSCHTVSYILPIIILIRCLLNSFKRTEDHVILFYSIVDLQRNAPRQVCLQGISLQVINLLLRFIYAANPYVNLKHTNGWKIDQLAVASFIR